jgi:hypothetical protein
MKSTTFSKVMSSSLVEFRRRFGGTYCVYLALFSTCFLLISCLIYSSAMKMETVRSSEMTPEYIALHLKG